MAIRRYIGTFLEYESLYLDTILMLLSINRFQFSAKNILTSNLIYFEHKKAGAVAPAKLGSKWRLNYYLF